MKLTATQIEQIKKLATENGMRTLVTKNQIGIGPSGQPWFACVYTERNNGKVSYDFRDRKAVLNQQFKDICNA